MFGIGSILGGGGGGGLSTSTTQTADNKTSITQGPVNFGANNVGAGAGGGNTAIYILGAVVLLGLGFLFKR